MKEELLHYVWRMRRFDITDLRTTAGEGVDIIQFGQHNPHAGPDFLNARIRIGGTEWAGNVEMHCRSSDWVRHGHSQDEAYNNVILHVVYEEDAPIPRPTTGEPIPCVEIKRRIPKELYSQYARLQFNERRIPCEGLHGDAPPIVWNAWLDRLLIERLQRKTEPIGREMRLTGDNREEVFYRLLARYFGVKVNTQPFERLARSLPLNILAKHQDQLFALEALLFGQAGLLQGDFKDDYPQRLAKEYDFLRKKYQLHPIHRSEWKWLRLRPANFPTLRIAQFAALVHRSHRLFSQVIAAPDFKGLQSLFEVEVSEYWRTHYLFDKPSPARKKTLGAATVRLIAINVVAPMLFHYGRDKAEEGFIDKALDLLESLPPEKNSLLKDWEDLGVPLGNAARTQALLQLRTEYCDRKRCLDCSVGNKILRNASLLIKS